MYRVFHHAEKVTTTQNGVAAVFEVPAPSMGALSALVVKQADGNLDGFSAVLYCSEDAAKDTLPTLPGGSGPDSYAVVSASLGGGDDTLQLYSRMAAYRSLDFDETGVVATSSLWLKITPSGAGAAVKHFDVGYFIQAPG